jgi:hypothetical protein
MKGCRILTTRKRVIVALVHTAVFLSVAAVQIWLPPAQAGVLLAIYAIVAAVLALLAACSGNGRERLYFVCCAGSACLGLAGQIWGGAVLQYGAYPRVLLLAVAAVTGVTMLRAWSRG